MPEKPLIVPYKTAKEKKEAPPQQTPEVGPKSVAGLIDEFF